MERINTIKRIMDAGVVAVIRAESKEEGIKLIDAIRRAA